MPQDSSAKGASANLQPWLRFKPNPSAREPPVEIPPPRPGTVIAVGVETPVYLGPSLERLVSHGLRQLTASSADALVTLLEEAEQLVRVAVLIYNGPGSDSALRIVETLDRQYPEVPVIVVVNEVRLDEYYELMSSGAYDCFGMVEGMAVIEQAVRWAAQTGAVPARAAWRRSDATDKSCP
jgi:DNA-binding NtrC family response regulator